MHGDDDPRLYQTDYFSSLGGVESAPATYRDESNVHIAQRFDLRLGGHAMDIAQVGNSGGQSKSGLYFEIRHHGKPVNPARWCKS